MAYVQTLVCFATRSRLTCLSSFLFLLSDTQLPGEAPQAYGLHPNSEIGYLVQRCDGIFKTITSLQGAKRFAADAPRQRLHVETAPPAATNSNDTTAAAATPAASVSGQGAGAGASTKHSAAATPAAGSVAGEAMPKLPATDTRRAAGDPFASAPGTARGPGMVSLPDIIVDMLAALPDDLPFLDLQERATPFLAADQSTAPYVVVLLQEASRMNTLLQAIRTSLTELQKGLDGQLNMSGAMEDLGEALRINQVPGRNPFHKTNWEKVAWPSCKPLQSWFKELQNRVKQLVEWSATLQMPFSLWLPGLFNPTALFTAIMQVTARRQRFPLDEMTIETHFTPMVQASEAKVCSA